MFLIENNEYLPPRVWERWENRNECRFVEFFGLTQETQETQETPVVCGEPNCYKITKFLAVQIKIVEVSEWYSPCEPSQAKPSQAKIHLILLLVLQFQ